MDQRLLGCEWVELGRTDVAVTALDGGTLEEGSTVGEFQHTAPVRKTIWMVLDRGEVSVCVHHPGFDPDVFVTTSTPRLVKALPRFFLWSPWVEATRARAGLTT